MRKESALYAAGPRERRDCSVRALSVAAGIPYQDAYAAHQAHGRQAGKVTPWDVMRKAYAALGLQEHTPWTWEGLTVAQFVKAHPRGRFLLVRSDSRTSHCFALVDGVIHDWADHNRRHNTGARTRVRLAFQLAK